MLHIKLLSSHFHFLFLLSATQYTINLLEDTRKTYIERWKRFFLNMSLEIGSSYRYFNRDMEEVVRQSKNV